MSSDVGAAAPAGGGLSGWKGRVCIAGGAGFIGSHLGIRLKAEGYYVVAAGWRQCPYFSTDEFCHEFLQLDLRELESCLQATRGCDIVFNLAAFVGGMGVLHASNSASILYNNTMISFSMIEASRRNHVPLYFFASSVSVYPDAPPPSEHSPPPRLQEDLAWPAQRLDAYGLEKLYAEQLCLHYQRDFGLQCRIARLNNVYGPHCAWRGGRERVPAAFCRKALLSTDAFEMWGDGTQVRTFCYIDDCVEAIWRLVRSDCREPVNIGSDEAVSMNELAALALQLAGKRLPVRHVPGPTGPRYRINDSARLRRALGGWSPQVSLREGMRRTFEWIAAQVAAEHSAVAAPLPPAPPSAQSAPPCGAVAVERSQLIYMQPDGRAPPAAAATAAEAAMGRSDTA